MPRRRLQGSAAVLVGVVWAREAPWQLVDERVAGMLRRWM